MLYWTTALMPGAFSLLLTCRARRLMTPWLPLPPPLLRLAVLLLRAEVLRPCVTLLWDTAC